ncbi:hybrid sensor histidine kinase/response regulator [Desulfococcaceae bacterium HSG9]|nr:hybrid sensor histidine kinase/response regulator [Desulfococcaceae bacterium HSG9]
MNQSNHQANVLIVDDVTRNIQIISAILKPEGYKIAFARSGEAALERVKDIPFDLILLDIMMPGIDGYETCRRLKNDPLYASEIQEIPVIFLTAKTDPDSVVKGFDIGAVDYITKPFRASELLARVKTHLKLKFALEDLQEANAAKDRFFSIIAHDLKGPFNSLLGYSDFLLNYWENYTNEKRKNFVKTINQQSNRLFRMLENLLNWSRMQLGKMEHQPAKIKLYLLSEPNLLLLKPQAEKKKIKLYSDIDKDTSAYGDSNMISTVIRNLISNAIKFTHPKGEIRITCQEDGDFRKITVSDTGIGIADENIVKLFRIDGHFSTYGTEKESGTGLGLILCKEFVEKNGGKLWVESEEGKGSKFSFTVPCFK